MTKPGNAARLLGDILRSCGTNPSSYPRYVLGDLLREVGPSESRRLIQEALGSAPLPKAGEELLASVLAAWIAEDQGAWGWLLLGARDRGNTPPYRARCWGAVRSEPLYKQELFTAAVEMLGEEDPWFVLDALRIVGEMPSSETHPAVRAAVPILLDSIVGSIRAAACHLARGVLGFDSPRLRQKLRDQDPLVRVEAAQAILPDALVTATPAARRLMAEARGVLGVLLSHPRAEVRIRAARIADLGSPQVRDQLRRIVEEDPDLGVRAIALTRLSRQERISSAGAAWPPRAGRRPSRRA